jgi:CBS domain containing-hemolysin-like protein
MSVASQNSAILNVIFVFICLICAALAAGLTQGLLSLNGLEMEIKKRTGTKEEKAQAGSVLPLINNHHLLLATLLLFNSSASEALPIFLDQLVPPYLTIILSVTLVLIFGEIIPSAIFTGPNQLKIVSTLSTFVWCLIFILYPIAYPISLLLDFILGHEDGIRIYNRNEIAEMMKIQLEEVARRCLTYTGVVNREDITMVDGALKYRNVLVKSVMTQDVFMLSLDEVLSFDVFILIILFIIYLFIF